MTNVLNSELSAIRTEIAVLQSNILENLEEQAFLIRRRIAELELSEPAPTFRTTSATKYIHYSGYTAEQEARERNQSLLLN